MEYLTVEPPFPVLNITYELWSNASVSNEVLVAVQVPGGAEIWMMSSRRTKSCCCLLPLNEDNGRFLLLAIFIVLYLIAGATIFSTIERPSEVVAHNRWDRIVKNFSQSFNISLLELRSFLRDYEAAMAAGIRADALRPRWDFTGALYFVGTVVSTIGKTLLWPLTCIYRKDVVMIS